MPARRLATTVAAAIVSATLLAPAVASARDIAVTTRDDLATVLSGASAGDRLILAAGSYGHVDTTTAFRSDVVVQPAAGAAVTTQGWWFKSGASHVVLRGLTIREPNYTAVDGGSAVQVSAGASDVAIEDCKLTEGRHGLRIVGSDETSPSNVTLRDSEITGDGTDDGIQVDAVNVGGGHDIAIDHNRIHDIHIGLPNGRDVQHDDGVQVFLGDDVSITRNTIWRTTPQDAGPNQGIIAGRAQDAYGVSGQDVEDVAIEDNLIYGWPGSGITISGTTNATVVHNTSYDAGRGTDNALTISEPLESDNRTRSLNSGLTIANDVIEKLAIATGASNPTTCTTNLVSTFNPRVASSACTSTDTSDPLFDTGGGYYLQSTSPANDAANASYPLLSGLGDRDETTRDATPDLGAREWHPLTDTLTGGSGVLSDHRGEGGVGWTLVTADPGTASLGDDALLADTENTIYSYAATWTPSDATYTVEAGIVYRGPGSGDFSGPVCRWSATGSKNGYMARVKDGQVELVKFVSGSSTILAQSALPTAYVGQPLELGLACDATKTVYLDGGAAISDRDDAVTQVGKAGVRGNTQTLPIDTVDAFDD